jgi:Skp family chaperone for outer membrane proteins
LYRPNAYDHSGPRSAAFFSKEPMMHTPVSPAVRRGLALCACVAAAALAGAGLRQPAARPPAYTRVAIVNLGRVMDGLTEGKDAKARLDAVVSDAKKQLEDLNTQIKAIDKDLDLIKEKDSPQYREKMGQKLVKTAQGKAQESVLQQLINEQEGSTIRPVFMKMTDAIQKIATRDVWDVVLRDDREVVPPERTADGRPLTGREVRGIIDQREILAANSAVDISQAVIDQMNNDYNKGGK